MLKKYLIGSASAAAILAVMPVHAQAQSVNSRIQALQAQIQQQQQQLQQQQQMLTSLMASEQQTKATVAQVQAVKTAKPSAVAVMSRSNRPGWRSADGQNEIDLGALLQIDSGINSYRPGNSAATFRKLQSGINARRAQIQVSGTFAQDFHFTLQYDMGGSNELFGGSDGGVSSGFKQALLSYTGFKPAGTNLSLEFGYETPPILLDEVIPSNANLFVEHPTPDRLGSSFSGGPGRGVLGFRDYTNRWFTFFAFSGPKSGDIHDQSEGSPPIYAIARGSFNIINQKSTKLQVGGGFQRLLQPNAKGISMSDEPELRVDPTTIIGPATFSGTGANPVTGGGTFSAELAGEWGPIFAGGSYLHYDVERRGLADANMWGAYGEVMYSITGEQHPYLASSGGWGNISPAHPFSLKTGGLGAWEVGTRFSYVDLNDHLGTASAVNGGRVYDLNVGLNWYVNDNVKFQLDWIHGFQGGLLGTKSVTLQDGVTKATVGNGRWDEIAIRSQWSF
ncbi:MAG TPA: porin [Stellaceae bacterium]|jgi:phosphate-selective porin OprO/OprP|nr:porin [Stellaceae bacterium]